jgi:transcriptional regulator GlxA family with amidase domain
VARKNLGTPTLITDFCRVAAVNQRTLLRAFRAIRSTTPRRYLHELRLSQVRQALLSMDVGVETVTQVAMRFGFRELGRFAVDYRTRFGESPSETLRRASGIFSHAAVGRQCQE